MPVRTELRREDDDVTSAVLSGADTPLLKAFRDGDPAVLEDVYRAYVDSVAGCLGGALRRYGYAAGGSWRIIAAELPALVEEVFVRAFAPRTRRHFTGLPDFGPALTAIARDVVVDHLRRVGRLVAVDPILLVDPVSLQPRRGSALDRAGDVDDVQLMIRVARYVAGLPAPLRRAHTFLYVLGLSRRDAAAALGVGEGAIPALAARLRAGLRAALAENPQQESPKPEVALALPPAANRPAAR